VVAHFGVRTGGFDDRLNELLRSLFGTIGLCRFRPAFRFCREKFARIYRLSQNFLMHGGDIELKPTVVMRDNDVKWFKEFDQVIESAGRGPSGKRIGQLLTIAAPGGDPICRARRDVARHFIGSETCSLLMR
jgi:hypothetical protein